MAGTASKYIFTSANSVARFCGIKRARVQTWIDEGMPRIETGKPGPNERWNYDLSEIVPWIVARKTLPDVEKKKTPKPVNLDDPDLEEGELEAGQLERLRRIKADIAEIDLAEKRRESVPVEEIRPVVAGLAQHLRQSIAQAEKLFGFEVAEWANDTIEEYESLLRSSFPDDSPEP